MKRRKKTFVKVGKIKIPWCKLGDGRTCIDLRSLGLKRLTFTVHADAIAEAERIARERHNSGAESIAFTAADRGIYAQAGADAKLFGVELPDAMSEWRDARRALNNSTHSLVQTVLAGVKALAMPVHPVGDVVLEILGTVKGMHKSYERGLRNNFQEFAKQFPGDIAAINATQIEGYLDWWVATFKVGARRRNNLLKELRQLFQFAKIRGYLPDKVTEARKVGIIKRVKTQRGTIAPELVQLYLDNVSDYYRPCMAIVALSGVRIDETILSKDAADWKDALRWEDFDWPNREICIREETSKTGIPRRVPILDCLFAWLAPYIGRKGSICPPLPGGKAIRLDNERRRITRLLWKQMHADHTMPIITLEYPDNAFRHTYISSRIPIVKSMAEVAIECGTSESRIKANYNNPRPLSLARAHFAIFPRTDVNNIIQLSLALKASA